MKRKRTSKLLGLLPVTAAAAGDVSSGTVPNDTDAPDLLRLIVRDRLNRHLPCFRGERALLKCDCLFQSGLDLIKNAHFLLPLSSVASGGSFPYQGKPKPPVPAEAGAMCRQVHIRSSQ